MMPMLMYETQLEFDDRERLSNYEPYPPSSSSSWSLIRVLRLRDLTDYVPTRPRVPMIGLFERLLLPVQDRLEVLLATGYCASVLLETLLPTFKFDRLVTLKLFVHTLNLDSIYSVYNSCPNLNSLALNVTNLNQSNHQPIISSHSLSITQLDLCTRLYLEPERAVLKLILNPLIPNLRLVNLHGEFHHPLISVFAILNQSPLTHLSLCFRNSFPRAFISLHFPSLNTLSISTYARPINHLWSSPLLHSITHLSLRTSALAQFSNQFTSSSSLQKLQKLKLKSLGPPWDPDQEWQELAEIRDWCKKMKIDLIDCSHQSRTIEPTDAYDELFNWNNLTH
ncbi:hypothetical protein CROQUDRAFT_657638 [Cronartium quercuum f. sp. fusiforme G11]|uniref:Uncharacterized protein n=1 Tax=Cronartium quercuum f. sp. fusiforme G11 TaxID=708437 RepID=A0A9P6NFZ9_9BASI|nr:hypothetical protein CROQUDRAFT_657638 [Cronartium quercuum f. sp. fusiforme G11]